MNEIPDRHWFALYTRPRCEFKAQIEIEAVGVETYLPSTIQVRQWSDRKKKVKQPLLIGYIFIKGTERERLNALEVQSIVRCVTDRGRAAKIPDFQMENLRNFIQGDKRYTVQDSIPKGTSILIKSGPFQGVTGVLIDDSDGKSFVVAIELLNRSVSTRITDADMVEIAKIQDCNELIADNH